jgi:hypothetical protein
MGRMACMLLVIAAVLVLLTGPSQAAGKRGGVFRMTMSTDLVQADLHQTSAEIDNGVLAMTVYETLFSFDEIFIGTDSNNIDICIPKLHYRSNTD